VVKSLRTINAIGLMQLIRFRTVRLVKSKRSLSKFNTDDFLRTDYCKLKVRSLNMFSSVDEFQLAYNCYIFSLV